MATLSDINARKKSIDERIRTLEDRKKLLYAQLAQIDRDIQAAHTDKAQVSGQEALLQQQNAQ